MNISKKHNPSNKLFIFTKFCSLFFVFCFMCVLSVQIYSNSKLLNCNKVNKPLTPGVNYITFKKDDKCHGYILLLPNKFNTYKQSNLYLNLHGYLSWPELHMQDSGLGDYTKNSSHIIAYPLGETLFGLFASWNYNNCCGIAKFREVNHLIYLDNIISHIQSLLPSSTHSVHHIGVSAGGSLVYKQMCETNKYFNFNLVSSRLYSPKCVFKDSIELNIWHAEKDSIIPIENVSKTVQGLAKVNNCNIISINTKSKNLCTQYQCKNSSLINFCIVKNSNHCWFGGNYLCPFIDNSNINLSKEILDL